MDPKSLIQESLPVPPLQDQEYTSSSIYLSLHTIRRAGRGLFGARLRVVVDGEGGTTAAESLISEKIVQSKTPTKEVLYGS